MRREDAWSLSIIQIMDQDPNLGLLQFLIRVESSPLQSAVL